MRIIDYTGHSVFLLPFQEPGNPQKTGETPAGDPEIVQVNNTGELRAALDSFGARATGNFRVQLGWKTDWDYLFDTLFPVRLQTGGGLVENQSGQLLLIRRLEHWDLPKGKLDEGESPADAALREVEEETGVNPLSLVGPLVVTYHTYMHKGKEVLKENHWFLMRTAYDGPLKPQTEEDITDCIWLDPGGLAAYRDEMFRSIRRVFDAYNSGRGVDAP
ncbi:NUDIX domain-containing protein [Flaviaesturariibacter flavus]|uniref:NUDIX domain-containing protein n=1 Tax=Flaviaesturariibacter flavus TaxID=2502780 RepID=A0A4R1BNV8_9BACT|nr:NUDIX domain-containing protein [Flaviaesturariibacter flavus]TCJ18996.1 NUDIX domain-containing protein [Flaviaesturariibacter flavus]